MNLVMRILSSFAGEICNQMVDLVFVLDGSESISRASPDNWQKVLEFVSNVLDYYVIGPNNTRVGVVQFSDIGVIEFNFTSYSTAAEVKKAIMGLQIRNSFTNTYDGLKKMRELFTQPYGERPDVPNLAIVFTDGAHSRETPDPIPEADRAQKDGITMLSVGVADANKEELKGISSEPKKEYETYWMKEDFSDLMDVLESMQTLSCGKTKENKCMTGKLIFSPVLIKLSLSNS